ncbi:MULTISPECIES: hypothetical protein [Ensifer]|jgi:hypothetical protein|uniref:Uncharacterized protein n=1 Tax=Ensifer adhaerens TaxID=106592 RepID=A0A9Q9D8A6_ENSAD|nr:MULTISPECIES: hypothetical protein [Ensifer]ANK73576.1 hypothetical protein FA04_13690 [Ensifer adhaerens]KDP73601.1 hypothetical protein FA04_10875 [Ensifer adhaerens]KQX27133.1 hypothetical protein ASD01_23225 [Ensifer sp. Root423]KQZ46773.1 hypothetical protein ASD63_32265 [Ensifer sp. Root558]MBD9542241.1 hypothetical protein [Ensifer sp. ENS04]
MVGDLQKIGIERLEDLTVANAEDLALRINATLGRRHINSTGIRALENLIAQGVPSLANWLQETKMPPGGRHF